MKHTPGEWNIIKVYDGTSMQLITAAIYAHPRESVKICDMNPQNLCAGENEANANLIAAAPELLEACKYAQTYLESPEGEAPNGARLISTIEKLQQIIAKAEGRE